MRRVRPARAGRVVALTGACSYLGRQLVASLEEDQAIARIVILDVERPKTAGAKSTAYRVDLTTPTASARLVEILRAEKVDALAHLAFLSMPTSAEPWAHELESVGTMHVLHACRETGVRKLVAISSTALYGPHPDNPNFLTESHRLRGIPGARFLEDKIEAEQQIEAFRAERPEVAVTVLRLAPVMGPRVRNWATEWLSRRFVPTLLGYDPLVQLLHETDAVAALECALHAEASGVFNIVGRGVLPLSTVVTLAGRIAVPLPRFVLRRAAAALWMAGLVEAPAPFVEFLRNLCVADGARARDDLGFVPIYSARDAALDLGGALRLREARMLSEDRAPGVPLEERWTGALGGDR